MDKESELSISQYQEKDYLTKDIKNTNLVKIEDNT